MIEVAGAVGGGPGGLAQGFDIQLKVTNPLESVFSWSSTVATGFADYFAGNSYVQVSIDPLSVDASLSEATATSLVGSVAGGIIPEGFIDTIIDGYLSSYNHGNAPGIYTIINSVLRR